MSASLLGPVTSAPEEAPAPSAELGASAEGGASEGCLEGASSHSSDNAMTLFSKGTGNQAWNPPCHCGLKSVR